MSTFQTRPLTCGTIEDFADVVNPRPGHRRQGVVGHLIEGAVAHAAEHGAPAVEASRMPRVVMRRDLTRTAA